MNESPPFPFAGEVFSVGAAVLWAGAICAYHHLGRGIAADRLNLFRNAVALVCLSLSIVIWRPELPPGPTTIALLVLSGLVGLAVGDTFFFASLARIGAQPTAVLQCLAPPLAAAMAVLFLDEAMETRELLGMVVTTVAVAGAIRFARGPGALLERTEGAALAVGIVHGALSALCTAVALVVLRHALRGTDALMGTAIRVGPAFLLLALLQLRPRRPAAASLFDSRRRVVGLVVASFAGTFVGVLFLSLGAKYAKAGVASTLSSTYPVWLIPLAGVFLKERLTWKGALCTVLAVIGVGILVS